MTELIIVIRHLLTVAEHDPDHACAEFDQLVACYGRSRLAQALHTVAGNELASLGYVS
jgi:hypothetical protein